MTNGTLQRVRQFLAGIGNFQTVTGNGMHKYNNPDHPMLTAMLAAKNIFGADFDLWKVNADQEYHEEVGRVMSSASLRPRSRMSPNGAEMVELTKQPFISVIIPAFNAGKYLELCLNAVRASSYSACEVLVVDDASTDDGAEICRRKEVKVLQLPRQSGPAAARNYGANRARGDVLFFVDADVLVRSDTVARMTEDFLNNPGVAAVFGSYDNNPAEKNFISQYKNLYHHFVHQQASHEAVTFWAGCGAIRRDVFDAVGGFDQNRYTEPSIEDIELGYRMRMMGYRILLDKELQVKHLKQWKMSSLIRADVLYRALPWSRLILESRQMVNDLNLQTSDRICAGLVGLSLSILTFSVLIPKLLYLIPVLLAFVLVLNYRLYKFFFKQRGLKFATLTFPLQLLYYFYSGTAFVLCWCQHLLSGRWPRTVPNRWGTPH